MENRGFGESWWGWLQDAKDKVVAQSSEVYGFVKKDIDEFTKVVTSEASFAVSSTATSLKEKLQLDNEESTATQVKKGVSGFLNHVAEVFTPSPDDDDQEAFRICDQQPVLISRLEASIYKISRDSTLYLPYNDVEEKKYQDWLTSFDLPPEIRITEILEENNQLKVLFEQMVPTQVTHLEFWERYFYQVYVAEMAEKKREEFKKRAQEADAQEKLQWDYDEELGRESPIPERIQEKLLEDYERERNSKSADVIASKAHKQDNSSATASEHAKLTKQTVKEEKKTNGEVEGINSNKNKDERISAAESLTTISSSTESNEDEWEKIDAVTPSTDSTGVTSKEKVDDWEEWK